MHADHAGPATIRARLVETKPRAGDQDLAVRLNDQPVDPIRANRSPGRRIGEVVKVLMECAVRIVTNEPVPVCCDDLIIGCTAILTMFV